MAAASAAGGWPLDCRLIRFGISATSGCKTPGAAGAGAGAAAWAGGGGGGGGAA